MGHLSDGVPLHQLAHALGDPLRLEILDLLRAGRSGQCVSPDNPAVPTGLCTTDLLKHMEGVLGPNLSYHLKELQEAGLITKHRYGWWSYYVLNHASVGTLIDMLQERYEVEDVRVLGEW